MDGSEALHRIRTTANGKSSNVPIICLTADAVIGAKERYLAEGFSDYITKPVDGATLEKMLMKYLPKDKLEIVQEEIDKDNKEQEQIPDDFDFLKKNGIDPEIALPYCQNNKDFYRSLLKDYSAAKAERTEHLRDSCKNGDWHEYAIYVHSLKSSSKLIGAMELSEHAARLEAAAKDGDGETIRSEHDSLMEKYDKVTETIRTIIPEEELKEDEIEIMEFWPEEK